MKKIDLTELSRTEKLAFLEKLQSKKFNLKQSTDQLPELTFERLESGMYQCEQTGQQLNRAQVEAMESQYQFCIELVDDLKLPPEGFIFSSNENSLENLLVQKN